MKRQASKPDEAAERFWDRLRDEGSLRAAVDRQAARIPAPDWEAIHNAGPATRHRLLHRLHPGLVLGAAACLAALAAVLLVAPGLGDQGETAAVSVVDQVFRSTASEASEAPSRHNPAVFSSVLKTIDAGFQRWDERRGWEE